MTPVIQFKHVTKCSNLGLTHTSLPSVISQWAQQVVRGTYADEPFIVTGRYLLRRRVATQIPIAMHQGLLGGFGNIQLRMDVIGMRTASQKAIWPINETRDQLDEWLDVRQIEQAYQDVMNNLDDIRPLRKLQSIQALAYRLVSK
jgi:hypothetical protein